MRQYRKPKSKEAKEKKENKAMQFNHLRIKVIEGGELIMKK